VYFAPPYEVPTFLLRIFVHTGGTSQSCLHPNSEQSFRLQMHTTVQSIISTRNEPHLAASLPPSRRLSGTIRHLRLLPLPPANPSPHPSILAHPATMSANVLADQHVNAAGPIAA